MKRGFTLVELLIVITIILIVSLVALPMILPAFRHRQVSEAARTLQGAINGARDDALKTGAPSGFRLLPDRAFPLIYLANGQIDPMQPFAANRIIPIAPAPNYSEGAITVWQGPGLPPAVGAIAYPGPGTPANPSPTYADTTALMVFESVVDASGNLNNPTSWFHNIRVGDQIQVNNVGPWYTVIGPMVLMPKDGNSEMFVNVGPPGTKSPLSTTLPNGLVVFPEFLLLVNGRDDNKNGWRDEGWDGVDNDGKNGIDDVGEWLEVERWN